ncbi:SDR family NAD(P)-dependent oxidoreductase [Jannaschia sp. LMIT008]|uniref:SDR family NAD(P)-dependent oxidoreductase n=1 Tax=Jannaschia maritima TaxID=3032585 RepID=UPI002811578E|nr:SDR family oxidoreductase [Jannaschia sp. LMIT008]
MSELEGRHALVTGASGGLGLGESIALARAGARVTMLDLPGKDAAVADARAAVPGARIDWLGVDLSNVRTAQRAVADHAADAPVDILVNNAAVNPLKAMDAYDVDEYERTQTVNATAAFALSQAVLPGMKAAGRGAIVHLTSITLNGGWGDFTAYVASKGTLLGLTRSMARELGRWNIRVNTISPGAIPTALETEVWGDQIESYEAMLLDRQALKVRGSVDDVAEAILFMVSDRAKFVTGQNLSIDGGWWMH